MVDRTQYADEAHTPKISLREIFGRMGLREGLCRAAADGGLLSVEVFAMLGDTAGAVKTTLKTMIPVTALGTSDAEQELSLMQLSAIWHSCHALQGQFATRRARMEEDPNKVPELAQEDHAEFRARFVTAHPDLSKNAEDLLTISKADEPDQVTDVQALINRVHALFMALEYLNICTYSKKAGPLKYMQELELFRAECPGLPNLMAADALIRKKVHRQQSEQRQLYPTFEDAMLEVLSNHKYIWNDARTKAALSRVEKKKDEVPEESDRVLETPPKSSPNKRRKRRARDKELMREAKIARRAKTEATPKAKAGAKVDKVDKDKRIPESEWKAIAQAAGSVTGPKRCHYYNSSMGCSLGDKCRFKHLCMVCGSAHSMVGNH